MFPGSMFPGSMFRVRRSEFAVREFQVPVRHSTFPLNAHLQQSRTGTQELRTAN